MDGWWPSKDLSHWATLSDLHECRITTLFIFSSWQKRKWKRNKISKIDKKFSEGTQEGLACTKSTRWFLCLCKKPFPISLFWTLRRPEKFQMCTISLHLLSGKFQGRKRSVDPAPNPGSYTRTYPKRDADPETLSVLKFQHGVLFLKKKWKCYSKLYV